MLAGNRDAGVEVLAFGVEVGDMRNAFFEAPKTHVGKQSPFDEWNITSGMVGADSSASFGMASAFGGHPQINFPAQNISIPIVQSHPDKQRISNLHSDLDLLFAAQNPHRAVCDWKAIWGCEFKSLALCDL